jgi:hypothetical protein
MCRALSRVVGRQQLADLVERHLQLAKAGDDTRRVELFPSIASVARRRVDVGRSKEVELVVVAQRPDRQARKPREAADGQQLIVHAVPILDPRVGRESSA